MSRLRRLGFLWFACEPLLSLGGDGVRDGPDFSSHRGSFPVNPGDLMRWVRLLLSCQPCCPACCTGSGVDDGQFGANKDNAGVKIFREFLPSFI